MRFLPCVTTDDGTTAWSTANETDAQSPNTVGTTELVMTDPEHPGTAFPTPGNTSCIGGTDNPELTVTAPCDDIVLTISFTTAFIFKEIHPWP